MEPGAAVDAEHHLQDNQVIFAARLEGLICIQTSDEMGLQAVMALLMIQAGSFGNRILRFAILRDDGVRTLASSVPQLSA